MIETIENILITHEATVLDAVNAIDKGAFQLALVVDGEKRLMGSVTDGDVRRGLLKGINLDSPVSKVMRSNPVKLCKQDGRSEALKLMRERKIHQVPVVDDQGRVVGLEFIDEMIHQLKTDTWVVLMAGGTGVRLQPLTKTLPKPMLPIGGRPLLETIIRHLAEQGFYKVFISLNHQRQVIQDHFRDGSNFDVEIHYLVETKQLGTAGSLSLLPSRPDKPMIVMNGDLMTSVQFEPLLRFHAENKADATLCVHEHTTKIRFGVVNVDGIQLKGIEEKPDHSFLVNAGIYVLNPGTLDHIPQGSSYDMPTLFKTILKSGGNASVFPIREYWLDIGQVEDLERAGLEFNKIFEHQI